MAQAVREAPGLPWDRSCPPHDHGPSLPGAQTAWTIRAAQGWWQVLSWWLELGEMLRPLPSPLASPTCTGSKHTANTGHCYPWW